MGRTKRRPVQADGDLRPLAKAVMKRALHFYDMSKEAMTGAEERLHDLIAEARTEMDKATSSKRSKKSKKKS